MFNRIANFFKSEDGQGMVEYGLIIALIAVVVIVALSLLGGSVSGIFNDTAEVLDDPAAYAAAHGGEGGGEG